MSNKWLYISFLFLFLGCLEDENQVNYTIIENKLKKELNEYKNLKWYDCYNTIILDAEAYVDTVLLVESLNASLDDGLIFPLRPLRPGFIGSIRLDDTTMKKPILDLIEFRKEQIEKRDTVDLKKMENN
jgi:hypothetical protein